MADDKSNAGSGDRSRVARDEPYELDYFAQKHGLSRDDARALIDRVGNDRAALDAAAQAQGKAAKPATARARSGAKAKGDGSGPGTNPAKPRTARKKAARSSPGGATVFPLAAISENVVEPVRKAADPVRRNAVAARRAVVAKTKRGAEAVERRVSAAPAAARKRSGKIADDIKSALPGGTASILGAAAAGIAAGLALNLGRKMVVQAPSAMAGDWFEAVKAEHKMALSLFDALQATTEDNARKRSALLVQLKHALGKHAFTEENVLYPALRAWGDKADADKLNHDHGYVKQYLYDLETMDNSSPGFRAMVDEFRAQIEEHIEEEEQAIFPPLRAALSDADNARLTVLANKEGFKLA